MEGVEKEGREKDQVEKVGREKEGVQKEEGW